MNITPGLKSSEFKIAVLTAIATLANAAGDWVSWKDALLPTLAAVGYILSRGFAKTEVRADPPADVSVQLQPGPPAK